MDDLCPIVTIIRAMTMILGSPFTTINPSVAANQIINKAPAIISKKRGDVIIYNY